MTRNPSLADQERLSEPLRGLVEVPNYLCDEREGRCFDLDFCYGRADRTTFVCCGGRFLPHEAHCNESCMSTSPNRRRSLIHGVVTACRRLLDCSEHRGIPDAGCHVVACHLFVTSQGVASNFLDGADDGFATDADTGRFSAQTKELPTIRPTPPMARATEYPR